MDSDTLLARYDGILRIRVNHSNAGFFAQVTFALNQLRYAEANRLLPVVYLGPHAEDGPNAFHDPARGENVWDYYFEPVAGLDHEEVLRRLRDEDDPLASEHIVDLPNAFLWYLHAYDPDSIYNYPYGHYRDVEELGPWYERQRRKARPYLAKYVRPKPHIRAAVEEFWRQRLAGCDVVGVHMRGSDKGSADGAPRFMRKLEPEAYFPHIDRFLEGARDGRIFLATDQSQYVERARARYGDRLVVRDALRADAFGEGTNPFQWRDGRGYRKGEEVLVDCLLLARSDLLLHCTSAVGEYALYFNPELRGLDLNRDERAPAPAPPARSVPDLERIDLAGPDPLGAALDLGAIDVRALVNHPGFVADVSETARDVNVVLGCAGRRELAETTALYLARAAPRSARRVKIVVSEMGDRPLLRDFARDRDMDYVFVPFSAAGTDGQHSEALAHNLAYFCAPAAPWYVFHCADVVVAGDWLARLDAYLNDETTFLQPFSEARLKYLTEAFSKQVVDARGGIDLTPLAAALARGGSQRDPRLLPDVDPGAPGGSIVVRREDFERVGGFEPEIFWGWSPEDVLLWRKLEFLHRDAPDDPRRCPPGSVPGGCHEGHATYPRDPTYVFHLHHPRSEPPPRWQVMMQLASSFSSLNAEARQRYLERKREALARDRSAVREALKSAYRGAG